MVKHTKILSAQLQQLLASNNRALITSTTLALILAYIQREVIAATVVASWLSLLLCIAIFRIVLANAHRRSPTDDHAIIHARLIKYRLGVFISGLVWGVAGFVMFPADQSQHQMFLIVMLTGLSVGGIISYSVDIVSSITYTLLVVVPILIRLLVQGDDVSIAVSSAGMLYLVFVLASSRRISRNFMQNIELRLDADAREQAVRESEERYRLLLNHAPVGIMHYNKQLVITYCNQRLADILHSTVIKLIHLDLNKLKDQSVLPALNTALTGRTGVYEGPYNATYSNTKCWVNLVSASSRDGDGDVVGGIAIIQDVTLHKKATDEIEQLAFYDALTNLPNRRLLLDRLKHALLASTRTGRLGAIMFLDLDHFKTLNDTLGHDIGDLLLKQVATRLLSCVREDDTVARLGGDEYVVMLKDLSEQAVEAAMQVELVGHKILDALNAPYRLATHDYTSTPSIGVAMFSDHGQTQEDLLKHADIAMYQAKKSGRNLVRFFDPQMQETINARASLEAELRKALERNQFYLHYQIQVDSAYRPLGAEVLIRWHHPERGAVSPGEFISLAEETGLIVPIGKWVLETACNQLKLWQQHEQWRHLTLSVNVSAKQFHQLDFVEQVQAVIQHYDIDPARLKLELTESMLLEQVELTIATMNALKSIGIRFSLDDFGTGYSSLQYLKKLPLFQLKIDQSFVHDIVTDSSDKTIVRTIIAMAQSLELDVIAEGVETEEQRQLLLSNGCDNFQGYLFSRPVTIAQFEVQLSKG